jgi:hypothetical protein
MDASEPHFPNNAAEFPLFSGRRESVTSRGDEWARLSRKFKAAAGPKPRKMRSPAKPPDLFLSGRVALACRAGLIGR